MTLHNLTKLSIVALIMMGATFTLSAQHKSKVKPQETILLYPQGQAAGVGLSEAQGPLDDNGYRAEDEDFQVKSGFIYKGGDNARFDLYFPKRPNGQMIIVCPGGGYQFTSNYNEGVYVADWMLKRGITLVVVKYRMPNGHWTVPLQDIQNTFRYCRAHASEWGIKQIGVLGFSAGGHLAASTSTLYVDEATRPDFSVLIYPVITLEHGITHEGTRMQLLGPDSKWLSDDMPMKQYRENEAKLAELVEHYSLNKQVSDTTPSTFIAVCTDDKTVPVENSLLYYRACVEHKVPVEMHVYPKGWHGWGFNKAEFMPDGQTDSFGYARQEFDASLERWLKQINK